MTASAWGDQAASRYFLARPLEQARAIAARVSSEVAFGADDSDDLLDIAGNERLRAALQHELPEVRVDFHGLAGEVSGTAHLLATAQWRADGHQPRDSPVVSRGSLEAALVIHLHAAPDSLPARLLSEREAAHRSLNGEPRMFETMRPSSDALRAWTLLNREHQQALYLYWQGLERAT